MTRFLWLNWSGGGNLPPSLGIARVLTERGHAVTFAGRPEMVPRVEAAGFRAIELKTAYAQVDRYPQGHPLTRAACYLTSPAVGHEVRSVVASETPDVILVDAMFPAALLEAPAFGRPTSLILHTFLFRQLDMWRNVFSTFGGMREQAGFGNIPSVDDLWRRMDRIVCTAVASFDASPAPGWEQVRHVGPVLEDEKVAISVALPWRADDATPLVLVSFSTGFEQRNLAKLQRTLDAIAALPVHAVATTGGIVRPDELNAPANVFVVSYAAHEPILARAAAVITHGGHGTAMRALRRGLPMVLLPGLAADQPYIATQMQEWGVGRALAGDADAGTIRLAIEDVLSNLSYRRRARQRATALAGLNGAAAAADELEDLASARSVVPNMTVEHVAAAAARLTWG